MSRIILAFFITWLFSITGNNAYADSCVGIAEDRERLTCFDQAISCSHNISGDVRLACYDRVYTDSRRTESKNDSKKVSKSEEAGNDQGSADAKIRSVQVVESELMEVTTPGKPLPLEQNAEKDFGKKKADTARVEYIEASIVEVKQDSQRIDYFRLDNGQVWRETEDFRVRFKIGQSVTIEKAVLGTYNVRMDGVNKLVKVKRVN